MGKVPAWGVTKGLYLVGSIVTWIPFVAIQTPSSVLFIFGLFNINAFKKIAEGSIRTQVRGVGSIRLASCAHKLNCLKFIVLPDFWPNWPTSPAGWRHAGSESCGSSWPWSTDCLKYFQHRKCQICAAGLLNWDPPVWGSSHRPPSRACRSWRARQHQARSRKRRLLTRLWSSWGHNEPSTIWTNFWENFYFRNLTTASSSSSTSTSLKWRSCRKSLLSRSYCRGRDGGRSWDRYWSCSWGRYWGHERDCFCS